MSLNITVCNGIIEEVSEYFAEDDAHDGGKIEKAEAFVGVTIAANSSRLGKENGGAYIDANCPGEHKQAGEALVGQLSEHCVYTRKTH